MIAAARIAGCRMNFRAPIVRCESADTDLCRGGCPVMREWKTLLARRRQNWKPAAQGMAATTIPSRPQREMQF